MPEKTQEILSRQAGAYTNKFTTGQVA